MVLRNAEEVMKKYWLATFTDSFNAISTFAIDAHPADWLAEFNHQTAGWKSLVFAMEITEAQYEAMKKAGYQ
jgi:hypothetical protein